MKKEDLKTGHCKIDGYPSFIRKINNETSVVCFFRGRLSGQICEKIDEFIKRRIEYSK